MAPIRLTGQVAVVTGAGAGLGRAHALDLAARGAAVVVNDLGTSISGDGASGSPAQQVCDEIAARGGHAVPSFESVATPEGGNRIVECAMDTFGRVDILVNNAGIIRNAAFDVLPDDDIDQILAVHLKGAFYVTRPAFVRMKAQDYGRIVFTASGSIFGHAGQTAYSSAKGGLVGLMRSLVQDAVGTGIKANAILPVAITRMADQRRDTDQAPDGLDLLRHAFGNSVGPEFVTPMVSYLASRECRSSGALYSVVGGRFARLLLGMTEGWQGSRDTPETAESVAASIDTIDSTESWYEPANLFGEIGRVLTRHL